MKNKYTFTEFITTAYAYVLTKFFYRNARLIRRPFYIRGKSSFQYERGLTTGHGCRLDLMGNGKITLFIGSNCEIGDNVHIVAHEQVKIGDNCLFASHIFISDTNHGDYSKIDSNSEPNIPPNERPLFTKAVSIGNNVWVGENVCILPGVTIEDGCIIGANSVVNRDISRNSIAVGSPARIVKTFNEEQNKWVKI